MRGRVLVLVAVVTLVGALATVSAGAATAGPGFHSSVTMPGSKDGSEPFVDLSASAVRYVTWQAPGTFASSPDGVHFTALGQPDPSAIGDTADAVDASGAIYNSQICGDAFALHTCVYRSTDGGHTWPQKAEPADSNPGASDRPWIDVYPRHASNWNPDNTTVYLEYHTFSPDDLVYVTVSNDGGKTFSPPHFITTGTNAINGSGCNTIPSGVAVDQRNGTVYALWLSGNDVATNLTTGCNYSQIGPFDKAWVSVSTDGGQTWAAHLAWQGQFDPSNDTGDNADKIFGSISIDRSGQAQALLTVRHHDDPVGFVADCETNPNCQETANPTDLYLVTSPNQGATWTAPLKLNHTTGSYFFPWVAAGSAGRLDGIFYRSSTLRPNDPSSVWYVGFVQVTGAVASVSGGQAVYAKTPKIFERLIQTGPIHNGGICTFGVFCAAVPNANRNLADSIAVALDPGGGANAIWTNDYPDGTGRIQFACQNSGASAYAGFPNLSGCYYA